MAFWHLDLRIIVQFLVDVVDHVITGAVRQCFTIGRHLVNFLAARQAGTELFEAVIAVAGFGIALAAQQIVGGKAHRRLDFARNEAAVQPDAPIDDRNPITRERNHALDEIGLAIAGHDDDDVAVFRCLAQNAPGAAREHVEAGR